MDVCIPCVLGGCSPRLGACSTAAVFCCLGALGGCWCPGLPSQPAPCQPAGGNSLCACKWPAETAITPFNWAVPPWARCGPGPPDMSQHPVATARCAPQRHRAVPCGDIRMMHMLPSAALAGAFLKMCVKKAAGAARIGVRMGLADVKLAVSPCFDFVLETGKGRPLLFFLQNPNPREGGLQSLWGKG